MSTTTRISRLVPHAVTIAAVAVLSGTTGAMATTLINGSQITPHTITAKQVRNGSLGANALTPTAQNSLTRVNRYSVVTVDSGAVDAGLGSSVVATCPTGTHVLGANSWWGYMSNGSTTEIGATHTSATAFGVNNKSYPDDLHVQVTCAFTG